MKNYGKITVPKGTVGFESTAGYNNWWYHDLDTPREFPIDAQIEHLFSWRNQDPYFVFKVHMCIFKPEKVFDKPQYVTIWFHEERLSEIIDSQNA